jgi:hypothetical protein
MRVVQFIFFIFFKMMVKRIQLRWSRAIKNNQGKIVTRRAFLYFKKVCPLPCVKRLAVAQRFRRTGYRLFKLIGLTTCIRNYSLINLRVCDSPSILTFMKYRPLVTDDVEIATWLLPAEHH